MINITDENLNRYLDGELSSEEAEQINSVLLTSEELQKKFNALKLVHEKLNHLEMDELDESFTVELMKKIVKRKFIVPKQQKYFIISVAAFITLLCLVIFGFVISAVISSAPVSSAESGSVVNTVTKLSDGLIVIIEKVFSGQGLSIIGSIFSIIVIASAHFFFEMQKRSKANLGN